MSDKIKNLGQVHLVKFPEIITSDLMVFDISIKHCIFTCQAITVCFRNWLISGHFHSLHFITELEESILPFVSGLFRSVRVPKLLLKTESIMRVSAFLKSIRDNSTISSSSACFPTVIKSSFDLCVPKHCIFGGSHHLLVLETMIIIGVFFTGFHKPTFRIIHSHLKRFWLLMTVTCDLYFLRLLTIP